MKLEKIAREHVESRKRAIETLYPYEAKFNQDNPIHETDRFGSTSD